MKPLSDFKGRWDSTTQRIKFTWNAKAIEKDGYIVIVAISGEGDSISLNSKTYYGGDIRCIEGQGDSISLPVPAGSRGVYKAVFCGISALNASEANDAAVLDYCKSNPECLISVMMGKAELSWTEKCVKQDFVKMVEIEITSNFEIEPGVLGYQYAKDGVNIKLPFPGKIEARKRKKYPPILIPKDCDVAVVPCDPQFGGNLVIQKKKKSIFGF
ncbi:MAG: hypothetical protein E7598_03895 [Ruminococcaceae bacterium]|nr:hypothetical protein [Oscillospiraceae bacterium]